MSSLERGGVGGGGLGVGGGTQSMSMRSVGLAGTTYPKGRGDGVLHCSFTHAPLSLAFIIRPPCLSAEDYNQ